MSQFSQLDKLPVVAKKSPRFKRSLTRVSSSGIIYLFIDILKKNSCFLCFVLLRFLNRLPANNNNVNGYFEILHFQTLSLLSYIEFIPCITPIINKLLIITENDICSILYCQLFLNI